MEIHRVYDSCIGFILTSPAVSQPWLDFKDSKDLRALHSNKTFKLSFGEFLSSNITVPTEKGFGSQENNVSLLLGRLRATMYVSSTLIKHTIGSFNVTRRTQTSM